MNVPTRLAAFAVLLAVVLGGSALAGAAIDPTDDPPAAHDAGHRDGAADPGHRDAGIPGHPGGQHPAGHPASGEAPR